MKRKDIENKDADNCAFERELKSDDLCADVRLSAYYDGELSDVEEQALIAEIGRHELLDFVEDGREIRTEVRTWFQELKLEQVGKAGSLWERLEPQLKEELVKKTQLRTGRFGGRNANQSSGARAWWQLGFPKPVIISALAACGLTLIVVSNNVSPGGIRTQVAAKAAPAAGTRTAVTNPALNLARATATDRATLLANMPEEFANFDAGPFTAKNETENSAQQPFEVASNEIFENSNEQLFPPVVSSIVPNSQSVRRLLTPDIEKSFVEVEQVRREKGQIHFVQSDQMFEVLPAADPRSTPVIWVTHNRPMRLK
jgi:hypothetical protein